MSCLIIDEEDLLANDVITSVEKTFITKDNAVEVYALKVDGEIYVADGIVTHNSIYIFRSADGAVFSKLDNFTKFKLKYNYRSYQEIIDYATTVYETISGSDYDYGRETTITEVSYKLPSAVECNRGYGGVVSLINASGECIRMKEDEVNYGLSRCQILDEVFDGEDPMILCRSNKQVRAIQEEGYTNVSTVHQAKGLEYNRVIVVDMEIKEYEDLNVAYVALTRARDVLVVAN